VRAIAPHLETIKTQYNLVAPDLQDLNAFRYTSTITHGSQEFMEAISFKYYLEHQRLITYEEAASLLHSLCEGPHKVVLSPEDYLLGIFDMTGEMMRFAITNMARHRQASLSRSSSDTAAGASDKPAPSRGILEDMRELRDRLDGLIFHSYGDQRDVSKKAEVMRQSVDKVESSYYSLVVRGAEDPSAWLQE